MPQGNIRWIFHFPRNFDIFNLDLVAFMHTLFFLGCLSHSIFPFFLISWNVNESDWRKSEKRQNAKMWMRGRVRVRMKCCNVVSIFVKHFIWNKFVLSSHFSLQAKERSQKGRKNVHSRAVLSCDFTKIKFIQCWRKIEWASHPPSLQSPTSSFFFIPSFILRRNAFPSHFGLGLKII